MAPEQITVKIRLRWRWWTKLVLFVWQITGWPFLLRLSVKRGYTVEQKTARGWEERESRVVKQ
jgi:hypothetical protein